MRKAIRGIAFLVITIVLILRIYDVLKWKDTSGDYISATNQLYSTEDNLVDVVFLGSSHCYCTIYPDVIWGNYGLSCLNMTASAQDKDSNYYLLKEVLKTQSPKVVCIEMWGLTYDRHGEQGNVYRNMLAMDLSKNAIDLIEAYVEEEEQKDYILRWPIIHTRYRELEKNDFVPMEYSEYGRGSLPTYQVGRAFVATEAVECTEIDELTPTNKEWLNKLYELSIEEGFELVFFLAPTALNVTEQKQMNAAEQFAKEKGIPYFDFNRLRFDVGIDYNRDFWDPTHMNTRGGAKVTEYLGRFFSENYLLDDHRGEPEYEQWEKSYEYFEHAAFEVNLKESATIEEYIARLKKMNDITYVFSFEGEYAASTLNLERVAKSLGLTQEQYERGGTYICADGKLEFVMDNESEEVFIYELNKYDSFKIQNMQLTNPDASNLDDIMLNLESVGAAYDGLTIAVYDNVTKTIIDKRGYF